MSDPSASSLSRRRALRASTTSHLPHWSEVASGARKQPSPAVASVLRDLVSWAADITILLTMRRCPDDRFAIERVRRYAYAWLAGEPSPDLDIDDVLLTAAALMAGIDRDLGRHLAR